MKAQQVRQPQQALREAQERLKKGGLLYRVRGQAKRDQEAQAEIPERLKQSMDRVNGWVERARGNVAREFEALAHRQEAERVELGKKIEDARKIGTWREDKPERMTERQPERGDPRGHGRSRER
jgi:hypothetical protein